MHNLLILHNLLHVYKLLSSLLISSLQLAEAYPVSQDCSLRAFSLKMSQNGLQTPCIKVCALPQSYSPCSHNTNICATRVTQAMMRLQLRCHRHTFVLDLWFGSSLECKHPAPKDGNCVWNTDMRPPVGDINLKAACRAGPNALCVSLVSVNMFGSAFSKSLISWKTENITTRNFQFARNCCYKNNGTRVLHFLKKAN